MFISNGCIFSFKWLYIGFFGVDFVWMEKKLINGVLLCVCDLCMFFGGI